MTRNYQDRKYIYLGKRDWKNLRDGYKEKDLIEILDDRFSYNPKERNE